MSIARSSWFQRYSRRRRRGFKAWRAPRSNEVDPRGPANGVDPRGPKARATRSPEVDPRSLEPAILSRRQTGRNDYGQSGPFLMIEMRHTQKNDDVDPRCPDVRATRSLGVDPRGLRLRMKSQGRSRGFKPAILTRGRPTSRYIPGEMVATRRDEAISPRSSGNPVNRLSGRSRHKCLSSMPRGRPPRRALRRRKVDP